MSQFLGFSDNNYSLVENVHNLGTGYISPQFNLVFDNLFKMVIFTKDNASVFNAIYNDLSELNMD